MKSKLEIDRSEAFYIGGFLSGIIEGLALRADREYDDKLTNSLEKIHDRYKDMILKAENRFEIEELDLTKKADT